MMQGIEYTSRNGCQLVMTLKIIVSKKTTVNIILEKTLVEIGCILAIYYLDIS